MNDTVFRWLVFLAFFGTWGVLGLIEYRLRKIQKVRAEMYQKMASPAKIEADMERSADFVESKLSAPGRTTKLRTDQQGQHAVIHKPKQIGPKVTFPRKKYP